MYKKIEKGIAVLYPDNKNNILRSRITNNKFDFVFLSKGESELDYVEEPDIDLDQSNDIDILDKMKQSKLDDLEVRYKILKEKIANAHSREQLNNIVIF